MYPLLHDEDIVILRKIKFDNIKINDLITFQEKRKLVTHRIIYKSTQKNFVITKGDHNSLPDKPVYPKDLVGKVTVVKRAGKILNPENLYLFQSIYYFKEIVKFKNILDKKRINFVFLKGLPIHLIFEKTHPRRFYVDCDLLIEKKDIKKVEKELQNNGYKKGKEDLSPSHTKIRNKIVEFSYYKKISNFKVIFDIHLEPAFMMTQLGSLDSLYPQSLIDKFSKEIMLKKRLAKIQGEVFPILSTENLIIYLALHLFHHNFKGYYRYELLNLLINKVNINYEKLTFMVKKYKFQNFVYPVFLLLNKYYQTSIPKNFLIELKPNTKTLKYIKKEILSKNIYADNPRISAGIERFKTLYYLSPLSFFVKLRIFLNKEVLYSIYWVFLKRVSALIHRFFYHFS